MFNSRSVIGLVLASAGTVFAIGLPWLLRKDQTPAEYVPNKVAATKDIQDFDLMWSNLESLQKKSAQLGPDQYKQDFLDSTIAYLQLDSKQTEEFVKVVDDSLAMLDGARDRMTKSNQPTLDSEDDATISPDSWSGESPASIASRRDAWSQWRDDQRKTSDLMLTALQSTPRHDLLAERRLLWLLKLDFSLRDAEKKMVSASSSTTPAN